MDFYNAFAIPKDKKQRDSLYSIFSKKYTERERYAILALNRLDSKSKWNSDTLVVPVKIDTTLMAYSPFPMQLDVLSDVKKFVVFFISYSGLCSVFKRNIGKMGTYKYG